MVIDHLDLASSISPMVTQFITCHHIKGYQCHHCGQDFLNSDNPWKTTKGTPQRNSLPWHEAFSQGLLLLSDIIDRISEHFFTTVIYSEGNPRYSAVILSGKALEQRYHLSSCVEVDASISPRKYETIGDNYPCWGSSTTRIIPSSPP